MDNIADFNAHYRAVRQRLMSVPPRPAPVVPPPPPLPPPLPKPVTRTTLLARNAKMQAVIEAVAEKHKIDAHDMMHSRSRKSARVAARHELFFELCDRLAFSQKRLSSILGFDHTSVRYGYLKHKAKLEAGHAQRLEVPNLQLRHYRGSADTRTSGDRDIPLGVDEGAAVRAKAD